MIEELVSVKRSKRAKRVALRLDPVERVVNLVIPDKMPLGKAYKFAADHENWVRETLGNLAQPVPFIHGKTLPIFGDEITLNITKDPMLKRTKINLNGDILTIITYQDNPSNRIKAYLKKVARSGLADIANEKAEEIGKALRSINVRETKSRWGSCSVDADISFSWRLIFAPYTAIDYVVAHEVAHLAHMDHSKKFWRLCEKLCINYAEGKRWMKQNGNDLMRYG